MLGLSMLNILLIAGSIYKWLVRQGHKGKQKEPSLLL